MARRVKIKRYRHIYKRRRFSPWKLLAALFALAAVAFVGASLYEPVRDFVTGKLLEELESSSSVSEPEPPPPESEAEPEPVPEPETLSLGGLRAAAVPQERFLAGEAAQFVEQTGLEDIDAVTLPLKGPDGRVLFQTDSAVAAERNAVAPGAPDLAQAVEELHAAGYLVIGRISAFRDPIAPYAQDKIGAVKYQDTNLNWVDADPDNGGKPWLNPYAPLSQQYITGLALEAARAGVDAVLLEHVQFPEGVGTNLTSYGEWAASMARDEVLSQFVAGLRGQLEEQGAALVCGVPVTAMLGDGDERYGGANPAQLFGGALVVETMPSLFGASFEMGDLNLSDPMLNPYETVRSALRLADTAGVETLVAMVQGDAPADVNAEGQLRALAELGIGGYVIEYGTEIDKNDRPT